MKEQNTGAMRRIMSDTLETYFTSKENGTQSRNYKFLPLCHTTSEESFDNILKVKALVPKDCSVYLKEKLLYFFYGKSAYLIDQKNFTSINRKRPVALLYDFKKVQSMTSFKRLLPFDSGGYPRYEFPQSVSKEIFTIQNSPDGGRLEDIVNLIYGDNDRYLDEDIDEQKLSSESDQSPAVKEIKQLYVDRLSKLTVGKQIITIEVQIGDDSTSNPKPLEMNPFAIFVPYTAFTEGDFKAKKSEIDKVFPGVKVITYLETRTPPKPEATKSAKTGDDKKRRKTTKIVDGIETEYCLRYEVREEVRQTISKNE